MSETEEDDDFDSWWSPGSLPWRDPMDEDEDVSNDATESYLHNRIVDGLLVAADAAIGMGFGDRRDSDAVLHSRFITGMRTAENAARSIAHARGEIGQGIAWVRLAGRLGKMLNASTGAAVLSTVAHTKSSRSGRGLLWVNLGEMLKMLADDCNKATEQRSTKALVIGGTEYMN